MTSAALSLLRHCLTKLSFCPTCVERLTAAVLPGISPDELARRRAFIADQTDMLCNLEPGTSAAASDDTRSRNPTAAAADELIHTLRAHLDRHPEARIFHAVNELACDIAAAEIAANTRGNPNSN